MTHTPTPWTNEGSWIDSAAMIPIAEFDDKTYPHDVENRARIVACVNFFHGRDIPTERIEEGGFWEMVGALQNYLTAKPQCECSDHSGCELAAARRDARVLLAKLGVDQ